VSANNSGQLKIVLEYSEDEDDFIITKSSTLNTERTTYMIIDEATKKSTLTFPKSAGLIQKRIIERRVASYIKTGFPLNDKGLRIGANFQLEKIGSEAILPDTLLTHGHTYARSKLVHDEVPDYIEKEDNYIIEAGSAGRVKMTSTQPMTPISKSESEKESYSTEKESKLPEKESKLPEKESDATDDTTKTTLDLDPEPQPTLIQSSRPISTSANSVNASTDEIDSSSGGLIVKGNATNQNPTDDALFALGQFIDQFAREGMVIIVSYGDEGRYKLLKLKTLETDSEIDVKYELDGLDLYQV